MSLIRSLTQEKNKLHKALELACNYLTDEQAAEIAAAMPDESKEASKAVPVADATKGESRD